MSIVIINNFGQYNHRISRTLKYLDIDNTLIPNSTSLEDIEDMNPKGIILGGGPDINNIGHCRKIIQTMDVPILGICLGHQIIAETFGGKTTSANMESYAQIELNILKEEGLFEGIGSTLKVWASHKDEIVELPSEFEVLANSDMCEFEAIKHEDRPIYGIQFHPEVQHTPRGGEIFNNFNQICDDY